MIELRGLLLGVTGRELSLLRFVALLAPFVGIFPELIAEHNNVVEVASGFSSKLQINCARIAENRVVQPRGTHSMTYAGKSRLS